MVSLMVPNEAAHRIAENSGSRAMRAAVGPRQFLKMLKQWYENRPVLGLRTLLLPQK
jgi:hypothetical protein